ncbi:hypothetical protein RvY_13955 [Ramazzottius varieornatus]|uniref:Alkylated DNA repair protein AlkB homologue 8 N-terminal domain-containing protein n=1 Tax=Ramazzottius varieornatus TaxID=947166 RepID=A0A1D1VTL5_RAMVA|nr:hypothetical protein RvY_13955 [Ramazzottius varieornatus]
MERTVIPSALAVNYLGIHIDSRLTWTAHWSAKCASVRKRIRYLNSLFKYRNSAARIRLFDALVQSLLDYCPSVVWSSLVGSLREIEKCAGKFLRTVRLGDSPSWSDHERYHFNALEVGWNSQLIRRIKLSLSLAYKLIVGTVSLGSCLFQREGLVPRPQREVWTEYARIPVPFSPLAPS